MELKPGQSFVAYRKEFMDPISPSFCAAKWLDSTIWLGSGKTASCHHVPAHAIDPEAIKKRPMGIHNTVQKERVRHQMLAGERPKECNYCWKIEELDDSHTADRVFKTLFFKKEDVEQIKNLESQLSAPLKTLEIAFDRICNFSCMYCSPSYSTSWVNDIEKNGPYQGLPTDTLNHYTHTHEDADLDKNNGNRYTQAFWQAWPEFYENLDRLRVTGGEPLLSPHFWKLLKSLDVSKNPRLIVAVNSNLGVPAGKIQTLLDMSDNFSNLEIFTSCESFGDQAEYIRDGLNWRQWTQNIELVANSDKKVTLIVSATINIMSVFSLIDLFKYVLELREGVSKGPVRKKTRRFIKMPIFFKKIFRYFEVSKQDPASPKIVMALNILRNPYFQSISILPVAIRESVVRDFEVFLEENRQRLFWGEISGTERLINYLKTVKQHPEATATSSALAIDLKTYLKQYDERRNKNFRSVFPELFTHWIDSLPNSPEEDLGSI